MSVAFRFHFRAVTRPDDLYYYTNWDRQITTTVIAESREAAETALWAMLGDAPRGRHWVSQLDKAEALTPAEMHESTP